jgi:hypothetical protein
MEVRVRYHMEREYKVPFLKFAVEVSTSGNGKFIDISLKEKEFLNTFADFSLPVVRAPQFAYAILAASAGVSEPIVFEVDEHKDAPL